MTIRQLHDQSSPRHRASLPQAGYTPHQAFASGLLRFMITKM